jgi:phosphatidylglycerophosphatase A
MAMRDTVVLVSTWFGAGRLKPASGTWGSLAAIPPGYIIYAVGGIPALALAAVALLWFGTKMADIYGKKSGQPDDQAIVADEVVGMWIAALPADNEPLLWALAFLLFRLFDVCKPWPASYFDKRKGGGLDVMMDDVAAGVYAMIGVASMAVPFLMRK